MTFFNLLQAILVQPYAVDYYCSGVAISANPYRDDFEGMFINVQPKGVSVTDGTKGTPEQLVIYDEQKPVPELISRSSETKGELILSVSI
jgi:hypothetical protein